MSKDEYDVFFIKVLKPEELLEIRKFKNPVKGGGILKEFKPLDAELLREKTDKAMKPFIKRIKKAGGVYLRDFHLTGNILAKMPDSLAEEFQKEGFVVEKSGRRK